MKKLVIITAAILMSLFVTGCNDKTTPGEEPEAAPAMVTAVKATAKENAIEIAWTNPEEGTFSYVQIDYTDPKTSTDKSQKVNYPGTSWELTGLSSDDGEITFKVFTVAPKGTVSTTSETVKATALDPAVIVPDIPKMVTGITATPEEGAIKLTWQYPEDSKISYLEISYTDPREGETQGQKITQKISAPLVEYTVSNLYRKYGEITFTIVTYNSKENPCEDDDIETVTATALRVPPQIIETDTQIPLVAYENITVTEIETREGSFEALFDNNADTYYHSPYGDDATTFPVDFDITLSEPISLLRIYTQNRGNYNSQPGIVEIMGSNGGDWTLISKFVRGEIANKQNNETGPEWNEIAFDPDIYSAVISGERGAEFTSPVLGDEGVTFTKIRYSVTAASVNQWNYLNDSFSLAEMKLYKVVREVIDVDPE